MADDRPTLPRRCRPLETAIFQPYSPEDLLQFLHDPPFWLMHVSHTIEEEK